MTTTLDDEGVGLARARRLLASIEDLLGGTGFVVTSTRPLSAAMIPALERLEALASRYWENLLAEGSTHDAAALLDEVGLLLERPLGTPHIAALNSLKGLLKSDPSVLDGSGQEGLLPAPVTLSLERARESVQMLENEVEALTLEVTSAVERLDARLHAMLAGTRPQAWAGTTEGFELQVLLLLELRFAGHLRFDGAHMNHLQQLWQAFVRTRFPKCGCRPLSAITDDYDILRQALVAFHASLRKRFRQSVLRSPHDGFASAAR